MNKPDSRFLWSIRFTAPPDAGPILEACLEPLCLSVSTFLDRDDKDRIVAVRVEGLAPDEPDGALLKAALNTAFSNGDAPEPVYDLVPPKDWLADNVFEFPALQIGRFFIHGSHWGDAPSGGLIPVMLDAGTAFGSGEHGSTAGCLLSLSRIARGFRPGRVLDMGCGSGILGIAAAALFRCPVVASDIDGEAARVTGFNAARNGVGHLMTAVTGAGYASPVVRRAAPYDLIFENILARPIRKLSRDLAMHLAPGGVAILSGLLVRDAQLVITAHRRQGLRLVRHQTNNGWRTLVFRKP